MNVVILKIIEIDILSFIGNYRINFISKLGQAHLDFRLIKRFQQKMLKQDRLRPDPQRIVMSIKLSNKETRIRIFKIEMYHEGSSLEQRRDRIIPRWVFPNK